MIERVKCKGISEIPQSTWTPVINKMAAMILTGLFCREKYLLYIWVAREIVTQINILLGVCV